MLRFQRETVVIFPSTAGYDGARRVWNAAIDRRPAAIARVAGVDDVRAGLELARAGGLRVAVRGGGHSIAGHGAIDGGVLIDLGGLRQVSVDRQVVTAGGGALWSDMLSCLGPLGLATPGGFDPRVGVAGLTLGGGYGALSRLRGMACDHLVGADVVTADGREVRAEDDPDLLWALRGAGANFGVATALRLRAAPVGPVLVALMTYPMDRLPGLLPVYRETAAALPDETTAYLGIFDSHVLCTGLHFGDPAEGARRLEPLRRFGPPAVEEIGVRAYGELHVADRETFPEDRHHSWCARFLADLDDGALSALAEEGRRAAAHGVYVCIEQLGGAMGRVAPAATAFPHRRARYGVAIATKWCPPASPDAALAAAAALDAALAPGALGTYVNYMAAGAEDAVAAYGENLMRLRELKRRYDPDNVFRSNVNVSSDEYSPRTGVPR